MNNPNRRKDDARPAVALQWGDRPDHWTLLLTGPNAGVIGPLGSTWPEQPAEYERVDVCVRRPGQPVVVHRCGEGAGGTWTQFYPLADTGQPLRDGEYLYREGAVPKLENIEQYRLQMAAIGTAALGYWKLGDSIHPDYDTVPLRDVAALYNKYEELFKFRESVRNQVKELPAILFDGAAVLAEVHAHGPNPPRTSADNVAEVLDAVVRLMRAEQKAVPDAVDAAFADAVTHGTGAFSVHADGSTKHVAMVRDALYPDYATPVVTDAPKAP